jgi:hypothetical protein
MKKEHHHLMDHMREEVSYLPACLSFQYNIFNQ